MRIVYLIWLVSIVMVETTVVVTVSFSIFEIDMSIAPLSLHVSELSVELVFTVFTVFKYSILHRTLPVSWYLACNSISKSMVSNSKVTIIVVKSSSKSYMNFSMLPLSMSIFEFACKLSSFMHFFVSARIFPSSTWHVMFVSFMMMIIHF